VIRIAPPLIISRQEIDWAFERIAKVIQKHWAPHANRCSSLSASAKRSIRPIILTGQISRSPIENRVEPFGL
jgi:hypothetical protein